MSAKRSDWEPAWRKQHGLDTIELTVKPVTATSVITCFAAEKLSSHTWFVTKSLISSSRQFFLRIITGARSIILHFLCFSQLDHYLQFLEKKNDFGVSRFSSVSPGPIPDLQKRFSTCFFLTSFRRRGLHVLSACFGCLHVLLQKFVNDWKHKIWVKIESTEALNLFPFLCRFLTSRLFLKLPLTPKAELLPKR